MIIAGIDPGLKGAIVLINKKMKVKTFVFPKLKVTKTKQALDEHGICAILDRFKIHHVFIEKVHAMPKQGVTSMFNFGAGWGLLRGICVGLHLPYTLVAPQTWKKSICKDLPRGTKDVSIIVAKRLFPKVSLLPTPRCKKPSDGIADALCLAEYGRRLLLTGNE